jgi:hypothetical protein
MPSTSIALQAALYERLSAEVSVPIYDAVPMDTPLPYVTIDSEKTSNSSVISGSQRATRFLYFSVWSDYRGQAEVKRINAEIADALNERPLLLASGHAVSVRVTDTSTSRDADGITYMGAITARIITQQ